MNFKFDQPKNEEDFLFINRVRNASAEFLHDPRQFSLEETSKYLQENQGRYLIVRLSGVMVGYVRVALQGSDCEIGADLAPEFQGRGLAKPIYLALLESWAEPLGIRTLYLRVLRSNRRAFKLYESMNFRVEEETTMDFGMRVDLDDALKALDAQLRRGQE